MNIKIASWNINSVRLRLPFVMDMLAKYNIDILALQETKTEDIYFPHEKLKEIGYEHIYFSGEKSYNGVALISKIPLFEVKYDIFNLNKDKRYISACLENGFRIHNFYVPAGGDEPDVNTNPKFKHKLDFLGEMTKFFKASKGDKTIIVGDFNIAPLEHDVWSSKSLRNVVSHTDIERNILSELRETINFTDCFRHFVPKEQKLYSWWSYRARDWEKSNRGRRLDHIWISPDIKNNLKNAEIHKETRGYEKPSDHALITCDLSI